MCVSSFQRRERLILQVCEPGFIKPEGVDVEALHFSSHVFWTSGFIRLLKFVYMAHNLHNQTPSSEIVNVWSTKSINITNSGFSSY